MNSFDYDLRKLQKRVVTGGISRRKFIKAASAKRFATAAPEQNSSTTFSAPMVMQLRE